jgi:hypothetical protein
MIYGIMKTVSSFIAIILTSITGFQAHAGTAIDVTISQLVPGMAGFTFIAAAGTRTAVPACAITLPNTWAIDVTTPQGQAIAASIITAFSTRKKVYIGGLGTCPVFQPNAESVFFIAVSSD